MLKHSAFPLHANNILMDAACIRPREWRILRGCGLISPCSDGMKSPLPYMYTQTHTHAPINTDAHACATPHSTLWHTDWLILWWACLWHTDCYTTTTETALPPPSPLPSVPVSLSWPPLVSMQFLAEKPLPISPLQLYSSFFLWRMEMTMRGKRKRTEKDGGGHREESSLSFGECGGYLLFDFYSHVLFH